VRGSARIYDVRMAQSVLKTEKLSHIIGARESRDLRSPSPIMAPGLTLISVNNGMSQNCFHIYFRSSNKVWFPMLI